MQYIDDLITRLVYKCLETSPSGGFGGDVDAGSTYADSTEITVDSDIVTVDET